MASFLVRVELYEADAERYDTLYGRMNGLGFSKNVKIEGIDYDLPTGTYFGDFNHTASVIRDAVKGVADPLSVKAASIFVCSFDYWATSLYQSS